MAQIDNDAPTDLIEKNKYKNVCHESFGLHAFYVYA